MIMLYILRFVYKGIPTSYLRLLGISDSALCALAPVNVSLQKILHFSIVSFNLTTLLLLGFRAKLRHSASDREL